MRAREERRACMSWITTIGSGIAAACPTQGAVRSSGWVVSLGPARILLASILAGAAVGLFPSVARAELPSAEPGFGVVSWETAGGVPGGNINAIARTPDGYLWLGTEVGLRRFDGMRFVPITMSDVPALGGNSITSLMVDASGTLWVGTRNGTLSRRVGGTFQAVDLDPRLGDAPIESLTADKEGGIWFATERSGLVHMARGAFEFVGGTDGLPPGAARSMVRLATGEWWAFAGLHGTGTASLVRLRRDDVPGHTRSERVPAIDRHPLCHRQRHDRRQGLEGAEGGLSRTADPKQDHQLGGRAFPAT